jgi:hypothetical protein
MPARRSSPLPLDHRAMFALIFAAIPGMPSMNVGFQAATSRRDPRLPKGTVSS